MTISGICKVILLTVVVTNGHIVAQDRTGTFSPEAYKIIPDIDQYTNSPKMEDRIAVLDRLVVRVDERCYITHRFSYDLLPEDYHHVIVAVFEGELYKLRDTEEVRKVLEKIVYTSVELKLESIARYFLIFLEHHDNIVQMQALRALYLLEAKQFTKEIAKLLRSPDRDVSKEALEVLVKFKAKEAVTRLITRLKHKEASKRYYTLKALREIGDQSAIPYVVPLLQDPEGNIRYWALETLVSLDAQETVPDIWQFYRDGGTGTSTVAALVYFGEEEAVPLAMDYINGKKSSLRTVMMERLVKLGARAIIPALVLALEDEEIVGGSSNTDKGVLQAIIFWLHQLEAHEAVPVLRKYANVKDIFLSDAAIRALGKLRAKEATNGLLAILKKEIEIGAAQFRYSRANTCAVALAQIGQEETVPLLLNFVKRPESEERRTDIVTELNVILDPELWETIASTTVQGLYMERIDTTLRAFSKESGIRLILHYEPKNSEYRIPGVNTSVNKISLRAGLDAIAKAMSRTGRPYTYILQNGEVHIMTIGEAGDWWESFPQMEDLVE